MTTSPGLEPGNTGPASWGCSGYKGECANMYLTALEMILENAIGWNVESGITLHPISGS